LKPPVFPPSPDPFTLFLDAAIPLAIVLISALIFSRKKAYGRPLALFSCLIALLFAISMALQTNLAWVSLPLALIALTLFGAMLFEAKRNKPLRPIYLALICIVAIGFITVLAISLVFVKSLGF